MIEKRVLVLIVFLLVLSSLVSVIAQDDKEVQKSYDCLKKQLGDNCGGTTNTFQNAFNLLAISYDSKLQSQCKDTLNSKKRTDCWGDTSSSQCSIKATSLAIIALKYSNTDVNDNVKWLLSKKRLSTDLTWYLEIDTNNNTVCTIGGQTFNIGADKKITGTAPSGLSKAYNNYWFKIDDINRNYSISCDKDFITTLLYKKAGSGTYYVSSETHQAAASDSTNEVVNGYCFTTTDKCDYEGTLWGALAMYRTGEDWSIYVPYLTAMADEPDNTKYLPYAFLYMLDSTADDYLQNLIGLQKQNKYWDISGDKLYDTSIALIGLQSSTAQEGANAKTYLMTLRQTTGDYAGCWPSNTALILYSGWPKSPTGTTPGPSATDCVAYSHYCVPQGQCPLNSTLPLFDCTGLTDKCCSVPGTIPTCEEKGGKVCKSTDECDVLTVPAAGGVDCCVNGDCKPIIVNNECTDNKYNCRPTCSSTQVEKPSYKSSCGTDLCCAPKPKPKTNWWLIILLIILIILVLLAIVFRNQLKIWWFKIKTNFKSKKTSDQPPRPMSPPPNYQRPGLMQRQIIPRSSLPQRPMTRPITRPGLVPAKKPDKDKEFDETMKKLRDMSK